MPQAADRLLPVHHATAGIDGWVSLEVSPLLANDAAGTVREAARLHACAQRANLFIKIPGTPAGLIAIEESIFAGVPVNVTLLFSREQYLAAADAYMRGIERRIAAVLDPKVGSVASIFISRWNVAVKDKVPAELANQLGIAIARRTYQAYRELLVSPRWRKLRSASANEQRLSRCTTIWYNCSRFSKPGQPTEAIQMMHTGVLQVTRHNTCTGQHPPRWVVVALLCHCSGVNSNFFPTLCPIWL